MSKCVLAIGAGISGVASALELVDGGLSVSLNREGGNGRRIRSLFSDVKHRRKCLVVKA